MLQLLAISAVMVASSLETQQPRFCLTGPRAEQFLGAVRARVSPERHVVTRPDVPTSDPHQVTLVLDDSVCAAVSRVLGGAIKSGAFPHQDQRPPFPVMLVRAGPKFFVHDSTSDSWAQTEPDFMIDTFRPRPEPGYLLPNKCWMGCCTPGQWTLLTPVTLRRDPNLTAPSVGHLPAKATVNADTGVVVVDAVGLVLVRAPLSDEYLSATFLPGDTLVTLMWEQGEGHDMRDYTAWWRGLIEHVDRFWDTTGHSGAQNLREPRWSSWIRMTVTVGGNRVRGWANMTNGIEVTGTDCRE